MSKIFSLILRYRINKWCESENIYNDAQFGFRDNRSTVDCIFTLHSIIQNVLANNMKLYCAFIDYEKAFDTVIHDALWVKLVQSGLSCKMLTVIKSIYQNVKSCVKNTDNNSFSQFFDISLGVKQGEPLSPLLFILFINDITDSLDFENLTCQDIDTLSLHMLLFADDIALFTTDPYSLQAQLNCIDTYSRKWGLKINVKKTKVCIFQKKKTKHNYLWSLNNEIIEIVDKFTYLGIKLNYNGSLNDAVKTLNEQALKAYNHLLSIFSRVKLDVKTKLLLFDSLVVPIITYGCEVWGIYKNSEVDKIHLKFCKYILGVRQQTSNAAVLGELGRFPLSIICKERSLKFWCKIINSPNSLIRSMYDKNITDNMFVNTNIKLCWTKAIKDLIDNLGFSYVLHEHVNITDHYPKLKQRLRDQYVQSWNDMINSQSKLYYYVKFKKDYTFEKYLECVDNDCHRKALTRFRLSAHSLEIETGRYNNIPRENRKCKLCNSNMVETEYHFLCICTLYQDLRIKYTVNQSFYTVNKFVSMMSSPNSRKLRNISKFIYNAMLKRNDYLAS